MLVIVVVGAIAMFPAIAFLRWLFTGIIPESWFRAMGRAFSVGMKIYVVALIGFFVYIGYFYKPSAETTIQPASAAAQTQGAQQYSAEACGDDQKCLRLWYAEYKSAITQELLNWRQFENDVADYVAAGRHYFVPEANGGGRFDPTTTAILHDIATTTTTTGDYHRHNWWSFPHVEEIQGVDGAALNALLWSCRTAIINMKYMLVSASDGTDGNWSPARERGDIDEYLKDARDCERIFNLPKFISRLRNQ